MSLSPLFLVSFYEYRICTVRRWELSGMSIVNKRLNTMPRRTRKMNTANNDSAVMCPCKELTIAGSLETILSYVTGSEMVTIDDADAVKGGRPQEEYDYVCSRLGVTPVQAELFAAILELGIGGDATAENVALKLGCSNLHFISLRGEIEKLMEKRYVRCSTRGYRGVSYRVPEEAIKRIQANEAPDGDDIRGLSTTGIVRRMNNLFREFWRDGMDADLLRCELHDIIRFNREDTFVKEYVRRGVDRMPECEQLLFLFMVTRRCAFGESTFGWEDFGKLFTDSLDEDTIHGGIERGDLSLMKDGIIENANNEGIVDTAHLCFVEDVVNVFLGKMSCSPLTHSNCRNIISRDMIIEKQLFYNEAERKEISMLTDLLKPDNFSNVTARLKEKGMHAGFCCLFYGKPGTGKTESAYQIARQTGRDVFLVDVSQLKSKWVGDSEKNIRALFQEYRTLVKNSEVAPILLFNEADAVLGVRKKGAVDSVDKMNNSIQNIILQEMESLEGILIATTNLTSNLDDAFERRFLIKVDFRKPDAEARVHIWETLIEGIERSVAETLAKDFEFSGGQIENVSRRATIGYILRGKRPSLDSLRELCGNETIAIERMIRQRIGFQ